MERRRGQRLSEAAKRDAEARKAVRKIAEGRPGVVTRSPVSPAAAKRSRDSSEEPEWVPPEERTRPTARSLRSTTAAQKRKKDEPESESTGPSPKARGRALKVSWAPEVEEAEGQAGEAEEAGEEASEDEAPPKKTLRSATKAASSAEEPPLAVDDGLGVHYSKSREAPRGSRSRRSADKALAALLVDDNSHSSDQDDDSDADVSPQREPESPAAKPKKRPAKKPGRPRKAEKKPRRSGDDSEDEEGGDEEGDSDDDEPTAQGRLKYTSAQKKMILEIQTRLLCNWLDKKDKWPELEAKGLAEEEDEGQTGVDDSEDDFHLFGRHVPAASCRATEPLFWSIKRRLIADQRQKKRIALAKALAARASAKDAAKEEGGAKEEPDDQAPSTSHNSATQATHDDSFH